MSHKLHRIKSITAPPKDDVYRTADRRVRIIENGMNIDYDCFRKTPAERLELKIAKTLSKQGISFRKHYKPSRKSRAAIRAKKFRLLAEARGEKISLFLSITSPEIEA